ncbi:MAG: hypothetical protein IPL59_15840 [Candidatus Competibacteraceae bacterium]|nr:hypothetical protein [Candidatus Competibacteraceae bacterium]
MPAWSAQAGTVTNPTTAADKTLADDLSNQTGSFTVALRAADSSSPQQSANNTCIDCAINVASLQVANFAKVLTARIRI